LNLLYPHKQGEQASLLDKEGVALYTPEWGEKRGGGCLILF